MRLDSGLRPARRTMLAFGSGCQAGDCAVGGELGAAIRLRAIFFVVAAAPALAVSRDGCVRVSLTSPGLAEHMLANALTHA